MGEMTAIRCKTLLDGVAFRLGTLNEARKRFSSQLAPDFNLFDYLRSDEMGVSRVIADILDPNGPHGQGGAFLQAFADMLKKEWVSSRSTAVTTEHQANGMRRIDVVLSSDVGIIGIENKPWARDQLNQLSDYAEHLELQANSREWLLIYIANQDPQDKSISNKSLLELERKGKFVRLGFHELADWVEDCAATSKALTVRVFMEEFAKFLRTTINGERDMSDQREVIDEVRRSKENIAAAFSINNTISAFKETLLKKLRSDLESSLKVTGFHLVWDDSMSSSWKANSGFGVKFHEHDDVHLCIEFNNADLFSASFGIRRDTDKVMNEPVRWKGILDVMQDGFGVGKQSPWWPWYSDIPNTTFGKEHKNWGTSATPWIEIENGELVKKIQGLANDVYKLFEDKNKSPLLRSA